MNELDRLFIELSDHIEKNDLEKASQIMNSIWLTFQLTIVGELDPDLKELSYLKVPIMTQDGGQYLLALMHVEGAKIQINQEGSAIIKGDMEAIK